MLLLRLLANNRPEYRETGHVAISWLVKLRRQLAEGVFSFSPSIGRLNLKSISSFFCRRLDRITNINAQYRIEGIGHCCLSIMCYVCAPSKFKIVIYSELLGREVQ